MDSSNLLSHPDTPLQKHLIAVGEGAGRLASEWPAAAPGSREACHLAGLCHDVGKATRFFQDRLRGGGRADPRGNHATVGAVAGWYVARERGMASWATPIAIAIARHHGNLRNVADMFAQHGAIGTDPLGDILEAQVADLRNSIAFRDLIQRIELPEIQDFLDGQWQVAVQGLRTISEMASPLASIIGKPFDGWPPEPDAGPYSRHRNILAVYGTLLAADKRCAAQVEEVDRRVLHQGRVREYVRGLERRGPTQVQEYRSELARVAQTRIVEGLERGDRRFRLTAPTGSGKTLSALQAALEARGWIARRTGKTPRIVYALPYISIIDQTVRTFRAALSAEPEDTLVLESHHLAFPGRPGSAEDEQASTNDAMRWIQGWEGEVIVTTFHQVMYTMFGIRNRDILRYPHLRGAIVILDEAQNFPAEHWPIVQAVVKELVSTGSIVIAMSATNPLLFEAPELAPTPRGAWPRERLTIFHEDAWDDDVLVERVLETLPAHVLVVANTVRRSRKLTRRLENRVDRLIHLSTNITAYERADRINTAASWLLDSEPCVVVTTQLIEAGVDLDFDVGFREMAPMDSIVQCLGRINRHHDPARVGRLHVFASEKDARIYGPIRMGITRDLNLRGQHNEDKLDELVDQYFGVLQTRISQALADERLESLRSLRYDTPRTGVGSFDLIQEPGGKASILVELNDEARNLRRQRTELLRDGFSYDDLGNLQVLNRRLAAYRVNTFEDRLPPHLKGSPGDSALPCLEGDYLASYYDPRPNVGLGLKWPKEEDDDRFL